MLNTWLIERSLLSLGEPRDISVYRVEQEFRIVNIESVLH